MAESAQVLLVGTCDNEAMRRILQVAIGAGHRVDHVAVPDLRVCDSGERMTAWKMGELLATPDVVVHNAVKIIDPMFGLLEVWERQGIPVLNSTSVGSAAVNKWIQQDLFDRAGIPHPHTDLVTYPQHVYQFADQHGYPFIVKPAHGSGAIGIVPVEAYRHIRERVEPGMDGATAYVVQQIVSFRNATSRVRDRKAVVVGGKIITVMERTGPPGEIAASRYGREDSIDPATLRPEELKYLPAAADAVGMALCTVDYWLTDDHPAGIMINEVNGFPGLPPREAEPFAVAVVALIGERLQQTFPTLASNER